jgi:hypothetical protein
MTLLLKPVREERRQVVVELGINESEVVLEIGSEVLDVEEDLLKVLFDYRQYARQLDVSEPRHDVVSDSVVLVADQDRELDVEALHELGRLALRGG